jgi:signal transduction histidine kinase
MLNTLIKKLKGDGKYLAIVFLVLIILSGIITPLVINYQRTNWDSELSYKIAEIENAIQSSFRHRERNLLQTKEWLKQNLSETFKSKFYEYKELIELVNDVEKKNYSLEIVAPNGKLIAWNENIAIPQEEIFPLTFPLGETYFHTTGLLTYLTIIDTIQIQNDVFYLVVGEKLEKHYKIQNEFYSDESFVREISEKYLTQIFIDYDPFAPPRIDGRIYSFQLNNLKGSKIGQASFYKPSLNVTISGIRDITTKIQSTLVVLVLIFIGISFKKDYHKIKHKTLRLLLVVLYLATFRVLIFIVGFPSLFLSGPLVDPANFSSTFAWGLVKSPVEFFITNLFLIIITSQIFYYSYRYSVSERSAKWKILGIVSIPALLIAFYYLLRGLSASIKSVIFDSTIRYFKDPTPIPDADILFMNLNVLMGGLSVIMVMVSFLILSGRFSRLLDTENWFLKFAILFLIVQIMAYLFFENLPDPLITPLMVFIFISLIFVLVYSIYFRRHTFFQSLLYSTIIASIITVILMNYFNQELEGRSLRTVAFEIIRANENLLHYMSDETLENALKDDELMSSFFRRNINYDAEAFRVWCTSPMQNESISSGIFLYDMNEIEMGSFSVGLESQYDVFSHFDSVNTGEPNIKELNDSTTTQALTTIGILPVTKRDIVAGYVSTTTEFNINNIGAKNIPDFLKSNTALIGSVIDESLLKIFEFTNSRITQVYGDIYPSREQMSPIVNAGLSEINDAWVKFSIYGEDYIAYVVKTLTNGSERLITVAAKEKEITWNLFNFFKIFLIHTIFILLLFVVLKITNLLKIQRSFRTKLLYAILFVSIVPLALLAVYNRQVVSERSEEAIFNELSKRSDYLDNHVRSQLTKHKDRELSTAFSNAGKELGISFSVYNNTDLIYSSRDEYYRIGLFHYKLNPETHYNLNYLSYREYSTMENIDNYKYDAYYRKVNINGEMYIIGVNDAFNRIRPAFTTADIDVILFGIYSFAVIIIIFVSTVLANQISAPIRRLTKATEAVAQGDLSVELENSEKGEMKDLYDVFNLMTHELQKNQIEIAELERESAWKEMAKQVAHEIKNPLTPVKLAIQQLVASYKEKSKDFDKTFYSVTKTTLSQIDNLSQIASEFSSFAKMPSTKLEIVNFVNVINDNISLFKDNVEIKFNSEVSKAIIESDESQMRRMLINIIRNSIQADASEIILTLSIDGNNYFLLIEDNGNGIDEKYKNEIFKMNFTTKEKGMGLGLKLAKRFIESIGGKIHLVESQPSKTVFGVIIPKHKSNNDLS